MGRRGISERQTGLHQSVGSTRSGGLTERIRREQHDVLRRQRARGGVSHGSQQHDQDRGRHPREQVRLQAGARHAASVGRRSRTSRFGTGFQQHIHGNKVTDLKTVNFTELLQKFRPKKRSRAPRRRSIAFLKSRGREVRGVSRKPAGIVPRRAGDDAAGLTPPTKSRFEMLLRRRSTRCTIAVS